MKCFFYIILLSNLLNYKVLSKLDYDYVIKSKNYRQSENEPLMYLYNGDKLTTEELQDKNITKRLEFLGYKKGIQDLDNYYLDYFNKNYNTNFQNMNELPLYYLQKIWPNSLDNKIIETNSTLNNLYYINYEKINTKIEDISYGKVYLYYIDTLGNFLTDKIVMRNVLYKEYKTNSLSFPGYTLVQIQGNQEGIFKKELQEIYYIYDKEEYIKKEKNLTKTKKFDFLYVVILILLLGGLINKLCLKIKR